jgi:hypothetical protein
VITIALALALSCAGAGALSAQTKVDYDHKVDFGKFKTFSLKAGTPAQTPFGQERLEEAVVAALTGKGWSKAAEGAGDVQVVTHAQYSTQKVADVTTFGYGGYPGWYGWGGSFGTSSVSVRDIPMGTLILDIVDNSNNTLVWRGMASDTMVDKPEKMKKKVDKALAKMLKNFPPKPEPEKADKKK